MSFSPNDSIHFRFTNVNQESKSASCSLFDRSYPVDFIPIPPYPPITPLIEGRFMRRLEAERIDEVPAGNRR
jgi:hypothetical protein